MTTKPPETTVAFPIINSFFPVSSITHESSASIVVSELGLSHLVASHMATVPEQDDPILLYSPIS